MNDMKYRAMVEEIDMMTLSAKVALDTMDMESFQQWVDLIESKTRELHSFMETKTVGE